MNRLREGSLHGWPLRPVISWGENVRSGFSSRWPWWKPSPAPYAGFDHPWGSPLPAINSKCNFDFKQLPSSQKHIGHSPVNRNASGFRRCPLMSSPTSRPGHLAHQLSLSSLNTCVNFCFQVLLFPLRVGLVLQLFEDLNPPYYLGLSSNDTSWSVSFPGTIWRNSYHWPHDSIWFSSEHLLPSEATYSANVPTGSFAGLTCPFPQTFL